MVAPITLAHTLKQLALVRRPRPGMAELPQVAALVSIAVGTTALMGWWLGVDTLKSIVPAS